MTRDRNYLISVYNATSTNPKGDDELETYEAWLERQLLSRIERLEKFEHLVNQEVERRIKERMPSEEDAQNAESRYEDEQNEDKLRFDTEYCFRDYMNGWEDCRSRLTNPDNNPKENSNGSRN